MATQEVITSAPTRGTVDDADSQGRLVAVGRPWAAWFNQVFLICFAQAQSGTTAQRPTTNLYPGRAYFDVSVGSLGKKIFVDKNSTGWVDSSGNVV